MFYQDALDRKPNLEKKEESVLSGRVRPQQGTEICNFAAPSPLDFLEFSSVDFSCFSWFSVQLRNEIAPKFGEDCPIPRQRERRLNLVTPLAVMVFLGPDFRESFFRGSVNAGFHAVVQVWVRRANSRTPHSNLNSASNFTLFKN